jgi:hypothetical protein
LFVSEPALSLSESAFLTRSQTNEVKNEEPASRNLSEHKLT